MPFPKESRISHQEFVDKIASLNQKMDNCKSHVWDAAYEIEKLLPMTNCKAVLEKLTVDKVEFMTRGPYAGTFLTGSFDPQPQRKRKNRQKNDLVPFPSHLVHCEEALHRDSDTGQLAHRLSIDPTQPHFFYALETILVHEKLRARGFGDEMLKANSGHACREAKKKAIVEARQEIWGDLAINMGPLRP